MFYNQLAQLDSRTSTTAEADAAVVFIIAAVLSIPLMIYVLVGVIGMWKTFAKAGKPGWAAIVPFYNYFVMAEVAGRPWWWGLGYLISPINAVVAIIFGMDIAKKFGKSEMFGIVALGLFSPVGFIILGTSKDTYNPNIPTSPSII